VPSLSFYVFAPNARRPICEELVMIPHHCCVFASESILTLKEKTILFEKLSSGDIQVRARRCDIDEDTMIKEMSEQAIINELQTAIDVWKKEK
jgi:hypothetical protein